MIYSLREHEDGSWWLRIDRAALVGPFLDRSDALAWINAFTSEQESAALVQRRSVLHDADAPVPSCTPADGSARGGSRHADTIDHYPADATAHTGLGGHTIGLMNRRDRHCLCGASERQPEQSNRYSSHHCFLPVVSE